MMPLIPVICWRMENITQTITALVEFDLRVLLETVLELELVSISKLYNLDSTPTSV